MPLLHLRVFRRAGLASLFALGGCIAAPESPVTGPDDTPLLGERQLLRTEAVERQMVVVLENGETLLDGEVQRMARFLTENPVGYAADLLVTAGPDIGRTGRAALAEGLQAAGTPVAAGSVRIDPDMSPTAARIAVRTRQAVWPTCPYSLRGERRVFGSAPEGFMGCASATALALMIADPGHLDRGVRPGADDAAILADHIRTLRDRGGNVLEVETGGFSAGGGSN